MTTLPLPIPPHKVGFDARALYNELNDRRKKAQMTWRELGAETRVSTSTFVRMSHGGNPDADGLMRMMSWLGTPDITPFLIEQPEH